MPTNEEVNVRRSTHERFALLLFCNRWFSNTRPNLCKTWTLFLPGERACSLAAFGSRLSASVLALSVVKRFSFFACLSGTG